MSAVRTPPPPAGPQVLLAEPLGLGAVVMHGSNAQAHVARAAVRVVGKRATGVVTQDADGADEVHAQLEVAQPAAQDVGR